MTRYIPIPVKLVLYHNSNSQCNICTIPLLQIQNGSPMNIGQIAHIIAHADNPLAPRYVEGRSGDNSYNNLILLCPTHHAEIDTDTIKYTIDELRRLKALHENNTYLRRQQTNALDIEINFLKELFTVFDFQKYLQNLSFAPKNIPYTILELSDLENMLRESFTYYYPFTNIELTQLFENLFQDARNLKQYFNHENIYYRQIDYTELCDHRFILIDDSYSQEIYSLVLSLQQNLNSVLDYFRTYLRV